MSDYEAKGWFPPPDFAEPTTLASAVRSGYLKVIEHGQGYFRITGRGRRLLSRKLAVDSAFEFEADPMKTLLLHFLSCREKQIEAVRREQEVRRIMDKHDYLVETEGGENL